MFQSVLEQAESAAELFERRSLVVHLDLLCILQRCCARYLRSPHGLLRVRHLEKKEPRGWRARHGAPNHQTLPVHRWSKLYGREPVAASIARSDADRTTRLRSAGRATRA